MAENAGLDTAQRSRRAVEATYAGLATGGVAIERLVHAKQDYQRVLK